MRALLRALKGDVDVLTARKWLLRGIGLVLLALMSFPLVVFVRVFDGSPAQIAFAGGYLLVYAALFALVVGLWRRTHEVLIARWQKTPLLLVSLIAPWLWLAVYELLLFRRPVNLMLIFNLAALLWSLMVAVTIPNPNLSKALAFLIVFLIGLGLITPGFVSYSHTMYNRWLQFDSLPDDSLDVVYVGNSHALNTFQPRVIDNLLGIHSYTAGTTSSGTQIVYHQVREVLESQSPAVIVFETLPLEVDETSLAFRMFGFLLPLHGVPALEATVDMFDPTEYQYVAIPLMYFHTGWQDGPLALVKRGVIAYVYETLSLLRVDSNALIHALGIDEGETSDEQGGLLLRITVPPGDFDTEAPRRTISAENAAYFERLMALCESAGVELLPVQAPVLDTPAIVTPPMAEFMAAHHLDFHDLNALDFKRIHFNDTRHLNIFGGMLASVHTAQLLSERLGIPIDEVALAQYRAILVRDLAIELEGDTITYRLVMVEAGSPDAEFRWHVTDEMGNVLADVDYAARPEVTFTLPAEGKYIIDVTIRNRLNPEVNASALLTERYDPASPAPEAGGG